MNANTSSLFDELRARRSADERSATPSGRLMRLIWSAYHG